MSAQSERLILVQIFVGAYRLLRFALGETPAISIG